MSKAAMFKAFRQFRNRSKFHRACRHGDLNAAVHAARRLIADSPDDYRLQNDIGEFFFGAALWVEAESCFRRSTEIREEAKNVNNLGRALLQQRRFDEARQEFQRAIRLDESDVLPRYNLTVVLRDEGNSEAAADALRQVVASFPNHAASQNDLGCLWEGQGDIEQALALYLRATELSPLFLPAHLNRIRLLNDCGRYPEAMPHLEALAAAGKQVRVSTTGQLVEIVIDGKLFYRGTIRKPTSDGQGAVES